MNDEIIVEGVEDWVFYCFFVWKCVIVMFGGLLMNFFFVVVIFMVFVFGIGV